MSEVPVPDVTFLHISGSLTEHMVYRPRPGHESSRPGRRGQGDAGYRLLLLNQEGRLLTEAVPEVSPRGCGTPRDPRRWRVRGTLALHPDGERYELRRGEALLYTARVAGEPPPLTRAHADSRQGTVDVEWGCDDDVTYQVAVVMASGRRVVVGKHLREGRHVFTLDWLPEAGEGTVVVIAGDGVRSREVSAGRVHVPARPPMLYILQPEPDARVPYGQPISVAGVCLDMAGHPLAQADVTWWLDGELVGGAGSLAALEGMSAGTHRLTMACTYGNDRAEASQDVIVEKADADHAAWCALHNGDGPMAD